LEGSTGLENGASAVAGGAGQITAFSPCGQILDKTAKKGSVLVTQAKNVRKAK
jgi:hypothetical protein